MASSPGPATPETTPQRATGINRSFTAPIRNTQLATPPRPAGAPAELTARDLEILYQHRNARIMKFTASKPTSSNSPGRPQSSSGTLPWASSTESTQAAGPFNIHRVRSTGVSFFSSGTFLKPILRTSKCWCVDGVSKFAFGAGQPDTYYRIELPGDTEEDMERVEALKETLKTVLSYEKTACPFKRSFTVDLPEEEVVEVRKKRRRNTEGKAKKWRLDRAYGWKPEGWEPGMDEPEEEPGGSGSAGGSSTGSEDDVDSASGPDEADEIREGVTDTTTKPSARAIAVEKLRSASAPQRSIQHVPTPSRLRQRPEMDGSVEIPEDSVEAGSSSTEVPTLRTFQAIPTDMPPSPPDSSGGPEYSESQEADSSVLVHEPADDEREDAVAGAEKTEAFTTRQAHEVVLRESAGDDNKKPEELPHELDLAGAASSVMNDISSDTNLSGQLHTETTNEEVEPKGVEMAIKAKDSDVQYQDKSSTPQFSNDGDHESKEPRIESPGGTEPSISTQILVAEVEERTIREDVQEVNVTVVPASEVRGSSAVNEAEQLVEVGQASLDDRAITGDEDTQTSTSPRAPSEDSHSDEDVPENRPKTPPHQTASEDPYAAIQARILARRSLSGTTSFHPLHKSPTRSSTSSTSSSATIISNKASKSSRQRRRNQRDDISSSLANRAYGLFLGPPAHIVAIMLKIAARFANGAFGVNSMFYVESPIDSPRKVPGSYRLRGDHVEEVYSDDGDSGSGSEGWEDREDDFGVPLDRPASNLTELNLKQRSARSTEVD